CDEGHHLTTVQGVSNTSGRELTAPPGMKGARNNPGLCRLATCRLLCPQLARQPQPAPFGALFLWRHRSSPSHIGSGATNGEGARSEIGMVAESDHGEAIFHRTATNLVVVVGEVVGGGYDDIVVLPPPMGEPYPKTLQ